MLLGPTWLSVFKKDIPPLDFRFAFSSQRGKKVRGNESESATVLLRHAERT